MSGEDRIETALPTVGPVASWMAGVVAAAMKRPWRSKRTGRCVGCECEAGEHGMFCPFAEIEAEIRKEPT